MLSSFDIRAAHVFILNELQTKKMKRYRIVIYAISEWEVKQTYIEGLPSFYICLTLFTCSNNKCNIVLSHSHIHTINTFMINDAPHKIIKVTTLFLVLRWWRRWQCFHECRWMDTFCVYLCVHWKAMQHTNHLPLPFTTYGRFIVNQLKKKR